MADLMDISMADQRADQMADQMIRRLALTDDQTAVEMVSNKVV